MFFLKRPFLGRRLQTVDNWNINKWQLKDIWKIYQKMHSFHTRGSLINTTMKISVIICCLTIVCSKNKSWDGRRGLWEGLGCTWPNLWGRHWQSIKPTSDWPSAQVLEVVWFVGKMLWIRDVLGSIKKLVQNRYQGGQNHVSEAESAMAEYLQVPFALGLNSGGSAIFLALKLAGVSWYWWKENDNIKSNRCLVPGDSGHPCNDQLLHSHPCPWGNPPCWRSPSFRWILNNISVLLLFLLCPVECSEESFQIDLESLKEQQSATGARHLLLCYMRGKLPDMEGILKFCRCWSSYHLDRGWPSWAYGLKWIKS